MKPGLLLTLTEEQGISIEDIKDKLKDYLNFDSIEKRKKYLENIPENESMFIAKENNQVVGVCKIVRSDEENRLKSIYILKNFQGKGIGSKLWNQAKLTFDENKPVYVALADYNEQAKKFYEKLGFVDTGKRWIEEKTRMKSGSVITEMDMILK